MKKGLSLLFIALFSLSVTGCGVVPSLYTMTEDEENQIVAYASKVVSKYNSLQGDGITRVYATDYEDEEEEEEAAAETADETTSSEGDATGETTETEDTKNYVTMEAALEQPGIAISYQGISISSSYVEGDYLSLTPDNGYDYLIMKFQLTNQNADTTSVDILSKHPTFTVTVDGSTTVKNEPTILLYDLATYQSDMEAGASESVVLLFQVPSGSASAESTVTLQTTVGDVTYDISL